MNDDAKELWRMAYCAALGQLMQQHPTDVNGDTSNVEHFGKVAAEFADDAMGHYHERFIQ